MAGVRALVSDVVGGSSADERVRLLESIGSRG